MKHEARYSWNFLDLNAKTSCITLTPAPPQILTVEVKKRLNITFSGLECGEVVTGGMEILCTQHPQEHNTHSLFRLEEKIQNKTKLMLRVALGKAHDIYLKNPLFPRCFFISCDDTVGRDRERQQCSVCIKAGCSIATLFCQQSSRKPPSALMIFLFRLFCKCFCPLPLPYPNSRLFVLPQRAA